MRYRKNNLTTLSLLLCLLNLNIAFSQTSQLPEKQEIVAKMRLVNDYWISQHPDPGSNQWDRAAYFVGCMDFYKMYPKESYLEYINLWAKQWAFGLNGGTSTRHADNQTCGQVYIDLYNMDEVKDPKKIADIKTSIDNMVNGSKIDDWWWVDAFFMSMPVFTRLGVLFDDDKYFYKMQQMIVDTKDGRKLYNSVDRLWHRDEKYIPPATTPKGENIYWSRGNGWAIAAYVRVLQILPEKYAHRAEYIEMFKNMAASLVQRQRPDGFWNVSLADPDNYGGPETSGTNFFTYALAWGINNGILDRNTYFPAVVKGWNALSTTAVHPNGLLGYVQGVGQAPESSQPVRSTSTADFGVGGFLLAGTEVVKLADGTMPVPPYSVKSVEAVDSENLKITFVGEFDETSALTIANYSISNNVTIIGVEKDTDVSVILKLAAPLTKGTYILSVGQILSKDGVSTEAGESISFFFTTDVAAEITNITASGYQAGTTNTPDKTVDNDFSTRWSQEGTGEWIKYDLGAEEEITSVEMSFYQGSTRRTYFVVQVSSDDWDYRALQSYTSNGTTNNFEYFEFLVPQKARYVKIIGNGNSSNKWNSFTEVRININKSNEPEEPDDPSDPEDPGTGIEAPRTLNSLFVLYPNPMVNQQLTINFSEAHFGEMIVAITDIAGRVVFKKTVNTAEKKIELNNLQLPGGLYFLSARNRLYVNTQKFIVE